MQGASVRRGKALSTRNPVSKLGSGYSVWFPPCDLNLHGSYPLHLCLPHLTELRPDFRLVCRDHGRGKERCIDRPGAVDGERCEAGGHVEEWPQKIVNASK